MIKEIYPFWFWKKLKEKYQNYSANINPKSKYAVVIVETREIPDIEIIVKNHFDLFSQSVKEPVAVEIFCSEKMAPYYKNKLGDGVVIHWLSDVNNVEAYNRLLTGNVFWESLAEKYNKILLFQWDSVLLRPIEKVVIDVFKYVGAPWPKTHVDLQGGNGGLSIRDPYVMWNICKTNTFDRRAHGNEDLFFCRLLKSHEKPENEEAQKIFVETLMSESPSGLHAAYKYLTISQYHFLLSNSLTCF